MSTNREELRCIIKDRMPKVTDSRNRLILKVPISQNRSFIIELDMLEHKFLATAASRDEWLWHYKLDHLNFNDISNLKRKNMVSGLLEIHIL